LRIADCGLRIADRALLIPLIPVIPLIPLNPQSAIRNPKWQGAP